MDIRGEYRFSSRMKQNKKAKICFVIYIAGKKKLLFYIYAVIVKQNFYKRSTNHYSLSLFLYLSLSLPPPQCTTNTEASLQLFRL